MVKNTSTRLLAAVLLSSAANARIYDDGACPILSMIPFTDG
jgi:hypothetical protein